MDKVEDASITTENTSGDVPVWDTTYPKQNPTTSRIYLGSSSTKDDEDTEGEGEWVREQLLSTLCI